MINENKQVISPAENGHECTMIQTAQAEGLNGVFTLLFVTKRDRTAFYKSLKDGRYLIELPFHVSRGNLKKEGIEKVGLSPVWDLTKQIQLAHKGWTHIVVLEK